MALSRLALIVMLSLAPPASAQVIDTFEEGPFSLSANTVQDTDVQSGLSPSTAIAADRETRLSSNDAAQFATADLVLTPGDDSVLVIAPASGASFDLLYRPPPTALTLGGTADRIAIELPQVPAGPSFLLILEDADGGSQVSAPPLSGAGTFLVPYANFENVDLTRVNFLRFRFLSSGPGVFEIRSIRAAAAMPTLGSLWYIAAALAFAVAGYRAARSATP
jgi:hypothetical protein